MKEQNQIRLHRGGFDLLTSLVLLALVALSPRVTWAEEKAVQATTVAALGKTEEPPVAAFEKLKSVEEMKAMTPKQRAIYFYGLQNMLVELNRLNQKNGVKFASQESRSRGSVWDAALAIFMGEKTWAAGVDAMTCIYAGWLQRRYEAGKPCPRAPQGSCGSGYVQCNPLVFGSNTCVKPDTYASTKCQEKAKDPKTIWKENESNPQAWNEFKGDVDSYCLIESPQKDTCAMVQYYLNTIKPENAAPTPQRPPPTAGPPQPGVPQPAQGVPQPPNQPGGLPPLEPVEVQPRHPVQPLREGANTQTWTSPEEMAIMNSKKCDLSKLLQGVEIPKDPYGKKSRLSGVNMEADMLPVLRMGDAQQLMCERGPINQDLIVKQKKWLAYLLQKTKQAQGAYWQDYYLWFYGTMNNNFDNCIAEAQSKRAQRVPPERNNKGSIRFVSNDGAMAVVNHRTGYSIGTRQQYIWGAMLGAGLSLCDVGDQTRSYEGSPTIQPMGQPEAPPTGGGWLAPAPGTERPSEWNHNSVQ